MRRIEREENKRRKKKEDRTMADVGFPAQLQPGPVQ